jgi:hypothetical protein
MKRGDGGGGPNAGTSHWLGLFCVIAKVHRDISLPSSGMCWVVCLVLHTPLSLHTSYIRSMFGFVCRAVSLTNKDQVNFRISKRATWLCSATRALRTYVRLNNSTLCTTDQ